MRPLTLSDEDEGDASNTDDGDGGVGGGDVISSIVDVINVFVLVVLFSWHSGKSRYLVSFSGWDR